MKDICRNKYKGFRNYLHNFAKFDGYYLLNFLALIGKTTPVIPKGSIITTKFVMNNSKYEETFKDSFLMLPSSLRKLCKSFSILTPKSIFPFLLTDINYKGEVPDIKLFDNISKEEYITYKESYINPKEFWVFKEEAIAYCSIDCISLYQNLNKFNQLIFDHFKINIVKYPTLSYLAFANFRYHYLVKIEVIPKDVLDPNGKIIKPIYSKIHMLSGKIAENIRLSNTGGAVDMYIPKLIKGKKIYAYDVNALYPSVMVNKVFPIGSPSYFIGNILLQPPGANAFGYFYCKIIAPEGLKTSNTLNSSYY